MAKSKAFKRALRLWLSSESLSFAAAWRLARLIDRSAESWIVDYESRVTSRESRVTTNYIGRLRPGSLRLENGRQR